MLVHHSTRSTVLPMAAFRPDDFVAAVNAHGVTSCSLAPTMLHALLDHVARTGDELPTLRDVAYGSAAIPADLLRRALDRLNVNFHQGYGMIRNRWQRHLSRSRRPPRRRRGRLVDPGHRRPSARRGRGSHRRLRRRDRRDPRSRCTGRHGLLAGADPGDGRRLAAHRRPRALRRRGPTGRRRPQQGRHHHRGRERVVPRGRGRPLDAS